MDHCCYFKDFRNSYVVLLLYVDDMLITGASMKKINTLKHESAKEFKMKNFGSANKILSIRISRNQAEGIFTLS